MGLRLSRRYGPGALLALLTIMLGLSCASVPVSKAGTQGIASGPVLPPVPSVPAATDAPAGSSSSASSTASVAPAAAATPVASAPAATVPAATVPAAPAPAATVPAVTLVPAKIPSLPAPEKKLGAPKETHHFLSEPPPVRKAKAGASPPPVAQAPVTAASGNGTAAPASRIPEGIVVAVVPPRPEEKTLPPAEKKPEPPLRDGGFGARVLATLSGSKGVSAWNRGEASAPPGVRFLAWELPGKRVTALAVVYRGLGRAERGGEGRSALVLALLADELRSAWPGDRHGDRTGAATAQVAQIGATDLAILLEGPIADPAGLAELLRSRAAKPEFMEATFPEQRFQAVLRDLRFATRKRGLEGTAGHPALGTEKGLLDADLESARSSWRSWVKDAIPSIVAVGAFSSSPARGSTAAGVVLPPGGTPNPALPAANGPVAATIATAVGFDSGAAAGHGTTAIRLFAAGPGIATRAVLTLPADLLAGDVAILGELLAAEGVLGRDRPWSAAGSTLTFMAEARQEQDPAARISASFGDSTRLVTADSVKAAKVRSLFSLFGRGDPSELALAMAGDIAAGGDGTWPFRLASEIETADASSVRRAAAILAGLVSPGPQR